MNQDVETVPTKEAAAHRKGRRRSAHPREAGTEATPESPASAASDGAETPAPELVEEALCVAAETGAPGSLVPLFPASPESAAGVIVLEGAVEIDQAAELKRRLQAALAGGGALRVDLERATELDVTAVQLVWAAGRAARAAGVGFTLAPPPAAVIAALAEAGLADLLAAEDSL
jgi:anti-anti-sigma regulatory factor